MGIESPIHLLFIALVALIVLGPKRLPGIARAIGQGIREFRGALEQAQEEDPEPPEAPTPTAHAQTPTAPAQAPPVPAEQAHEPPADALASASSEAPEPTIPLEDSPPR